MQAPDDGDIWIALTREPLPMGRAADWAVAPDCGAVVLFCGTARNHSPGRPDVRSLEYEAYEEQASKRLEAVAAEARKRWPDLGRIALLHRLGPVAVGESAIVVAVSSPHRTEAFAAARFCLDTVKRTVPIWKRESWAGGDDWALDARPIEDLSDLSDLSDLPVAELAATELAATEAVAGFAAAVALADPDPVTRP